MPINSELPITLPPQSSLVTVGGIQLDALILAARSPNTIRGYRSDLSHFDQWGGRFPTTPAVVIAYIEDMISAGYKITTIRRRISALSFIHRYSSKCFSDPTQDGRVVLALQAAARRIPNNRDMAAAIRINEFWQLINSFAGCRRLIDKRNKSLLLTLLFGAFRISEVLAFDVKHLEFTAEGVILKMPMGHKGDRLEGARKGIRFQSKLGAGCPVLALKEWLKASGIEEGPVFRGVSRHGQVAGKGMHTSSVNRAIKSAARRAGLECPNRFSSHSGRTTYVTLAEQAGISPSHTQRQTKHADLQTMVNYYNEQNPFLNTGQESLGDLIAFGREST